MRSPARTTMAACALAGATVLAGASVLAGCADGSTGAVAPPPSVAAHSLSVATMTAALAAFDTADSAASSAGRVATLRQDEAFPSLASSIAAVNRNRLAKRTQPGFHHTGATFAAAGGASSCFLATATLKSTGQELGQTDLSEFVPSGTGGWRLSDHAMIAQPDQTEVQALSAAPAVQPATAIPAARRAAVEQQLFTRSTGAGTDDAVVAPNALLDQQFAGGWQVYQQEMGRYGMSVRRTLAATSWAPCAGAVKGSTLAFVRISAVDTVVSTRPGGKAVLSPASPDVSGVGRSTPVVGATITVHRVQDYLVSVPDRAAGATRVLAISDAPTGIEAT